MPHRHQLGHRDVAPGEIEHLIGTVVAMETDPPPPGAHVQRQLGAVVEGLGRGYNGRIRYIALTETAECIADKRLAGRELRLILQMLELAAAAFVRQIVGTARVHSQGRRLDHSLDAGTSEPLVVANLAQLDHIARSGTRHKDSFAVGQPPYPISSGGKTEDTELRHRSASLRACLVHWLVDASSEAMAGRRPSRTSCSASVAAMARS